MENLNEEFTPMMVGRHDQANYQLISELYEELLTVLNPFRWECEGMFNVASMPAAEIIDILNMDKSNLVIYMKRSYITANEISFPGLNVDKIIENDLLELPEGFKNLLQAKNEIEHVIEKILETSFRFPVSSLFIEEENIFGITEEFKTELAKSTSVMTESQIQNEVVIAIQKFCDVVNDLIDLKIIRPEGNQWNFVGDKLSLSIENSKGSSRPLSPYRKMFLRTPLSRFGSKKLFAAPEDRSRSAILR
jgi:hypothetical protein